VKRTADDFLRDAVERAQHAAEHIRGMTKEQFLADRAAEMLSPNALRMSEKLLIGQSNLIRHCSTTLKDAPLMKCGISCPTPISESTLPCSGMPRSRTFRNSNATSRTYYNVGRRNPPANPWLLNRKPALKKSYAALYQYHCPACDRLARANGEYK